MKSQIGAFSKEKALVAAFSVIVKTSWTFVSLASLVSVTMQSKQLVPRVRRGPEVPQWTAIIQSQDYQHWRHGDTGAHIDSLMETCGELGSVFSDLDWEILLVVSQLHTCNISVI